MSDNSTNKSDILKHPAAVVLALFIGASAVGAVYTSRQAKMITPATETPDTRGTSSDDVEGDGLPEAVRL